jgi:hypothetical protein
MGFEQRNRAAALAVMQAISRDDAEAVGALTADAATGEGVAR